MQIQNSRALKIRPPRNARTTFSPPPLGSCAMKFCPPITNTLICTVSYHIILYINISCQTKSVETKFVKKYSDLMVNHNAVAKIFRVISCDFRTAFRWLCTEILPPLQRLALKFCPPQFPCTEIYAPPPICTAPLP